MSISWLPACIPSIITFVILIGPETIDKSAEDFIFSTTLVLLLEHFHSCCATAHKIFNLQSSRSFIQPQSTWFQKRRPRRRRPGSFLEPFIWLILREQWPHGMLRVEAATLFLFPRRQMTPTIR